ncbi:MAG: thiamine pyrophosphate-dependent dehydrogenase E1 component subunit alpha [Chloroflexi bacterium]|nr:thiamine pyrophosphate-dependent dehydrogenase E1 component subunit alpha [Chloroflexota bacterium]
MTELSNEKLIQMYRQLVLARQLEEVLCQNFAEGKVPGWLHSRMGQEAAGVATCACLKEGDYLVPYLSRSYLLGKGIGLKEFVAEIFGRTTGVNQGKGGEGHIHVPERRIFGMSGIVGGGFGISTGLGYAARMRDKSEIVVHQFGEGASCRGSFHEALNLASVWALPIVYICENNCYAEFTPQTGQMNIKDVSLRAKAYGMPGTTVDGNDVLAVYDVVSEAVRRAREGKGPSLVEAKTYRWRGHYEGDPMVYRTVEELEEWKKKDPVPRFRECLLGSKVFDQAQASAIEKEIAQELQDAVEFALESPWPTQEDIVVGAFAP